MKRPDIEKYERQARRYVGKDWNGTKPKWLIRIELVEYIKYLEAKAA